MVRSSRIRLLTGLSVAIALCPSSLFGDVTAANPGVTLQGVEATQPKPRANPEPEFSMPPRPPMNAPVGSLKLQLNSFNITGNTVFSNPSLNHLVSEFVGAKTSFADLLRAANKITNFYRDAGYLVARAYVPEQEIQDGVVEITVLEGLVGQVAVDNKAPVSDKLVNRYLSNIHTGTVVSRKNVERTMLLLNDLPGVEANATFKIGKVEGTTDLDVDLRSGRRVTGTLDANNYGSDFTGQGRIGGSVYINGLMGQGDALGLRVLTSEDGDTMYGSIDYSVAIGGLGTRVGLKFSNLDSDVGGAFAVLDLESEAETRGFFVTHPVVRSRDLNVYTQASIERRDVEQIFGGALSSTSSNDDINVFTLAVSGDYRDPMLGGGLSTYGFSYQRGLDELESFESSRLGAEGKFTKIGVSYQRLQYFSDKASFLARFAGQFSEDPMVSSEQFSLGGPGTVRAFINGERLADSGLVVTGELRRNLSFTNKFITSAQLLGFYDYGYGQINEAVNGTDDEFDISGLGVGFKLGIIGNYQVDVSYARSISGQATTDDDDGQFLIQAIKWFD